MSSASLTLTDLIENPQRIADIPTNTILPLLYQLTALQGALTARLLNGATPNNGQPDTPPQDRLLHPQQAATLLGVTVHWLYRHAHHLPFTRRLSRKALRFSESALQQWLKTRRA